MRVAVWVNPILSADVGVRINRDRHTADPIDGAYASNPSDDAAVAEALSLDGAERIGVFAMGTQQAEPFLRDYLAAGVEEVWLIDVQAQAIEISSADGSRVVRGADVARSACMAGLALVPSELLKLE